MVTVDCGCASVPADGLWDTTMPSGIVGSLGRQATTVEPEADLLE